MSDFTAQTWPASEFIHSVGVMEHLHYDDTPYWNRWPMVQGLMLASGIRHTRDSAVHGGRPEFYQRHAALGRAGITCTFIAGINDTPEQLTAFPELVGAGFEAWEGPNETDYGHPEGWAERLRASMQTLAAAAPTWPIVGPSLINDGGLSYQELGPVPWATYSCVHRYLSGHAPESAGWGDNGYGSVDWFLGLGRLQGAMPLMCTEAGCDAKDAGDARIARLLPRMLLEHFRRGIVRTWLYELVDFPQPNLPNTSGFGLVRSNGVPKPAYFAVQSLMRLLADVGLSGPPTPLAFTLKGDTTDVRAMAFQKATGEYLIAIWLGVEGDAATRALTLAVPEPFRMVGLHQWLTDGSTSWHTLIPSTKTSIRARTALQLVLVEPPLVMA